MSAIPFVPDPDRIQRAARLVRPLMAAHRFSTKGMEHVPRSGGCLMVVHHSLATYDGFLLGLDIWDRTGRLGRGLGTTASSRPRASRARPRHRPGAGLPDRGPGAAGRR